MKSLASGLCALLIAVRAGAADDALAAAFLYPPSDARPLVFWQWVNGNVSQEGIRLDLEWMKHAGIAGALMFDIGFRSPPVPQYVEERVGFGSPRWQAAVRFAGEEVRRLGLLLGAQSGGGWSVSGGPEVAPEDGMKKLVWVEMELTAPWKRVSLAAPPRATGPFQDLPLDARVGGPQAFGEVAVIAWRLPDDEQRTSRPIISGVPDAHVLDDGRFGVSSELEPDAQGQAIISARFVRGARARALTLCVEGAMPRGTVEASDDGTAWRPLIHLPAPAAHPSAAQTFALTDNAPFWRVRFGGLTGSLKIREARFDSAARIHRFEEKAGFGVLAAADAITPQVDTRASIDPRHVIDVTQHLKEDGSLEWTPSSGRWIVARFGWSLTGRTSVPATDESRGLEVDKLDAGAVRRFAESFYGRYRIAMGLKPGNAGPLAIALTDSWEAGQQNWTPSMLEEFRKRRGYDLRPWLPVLTGRIMGDVERSERVLADFRRTIADLVADAHYGVLAEVARANGMLLYSEAAGTGLPTLADGLQAKGRTDVPMGEYWYYPPDARPDPAHVADVREAASAAHIYGRNIVAAEALTTRGEEPFAQGPRQWRRIVDRFFAEGINRVVLHTSVHQPFVERRPGITLRQYGQHFTRNETWASDAHAWVKYLARTSALLQQGVPVADIAVFVGDDVPATAAIAGPRAYDYDLVNAEVLLRARLHDGRLLLADSVGAPRYRVLVRPPDGRASERTRQKLQELAADGLVIAGSVQDAEAALRVMGVAPDVSADASALHWTHRATNDTDVYFVTNQSPQPFAGAVRFRVRERHVEGWNSVTGKRTALRYTSVGGTTAVELELGAFDSLFVVLRGPPRPPVPAQSLETLATLDDAWRVEFPGAGVPPRRFTRLESWTASNDPAIRYYSGRAHYRREISVPAHWLGENRRLWLDLGQVAELAHVFVNGRDLGVSWSEPDRIDITGALQPGANRIEIVVTNYWANRMIGDKQPGARAQTFASIDPFTAASPLRLSGLLGPVRLLGSRE